MHMKKNKKNKKKGRKIRRVFTVKLIIEALLLNGWEIVREKNGGDHRQLHCPGNDNIITIAGHLNDELPRGIVGKIQRDCGLRFRAIIVW